MTVDGVRHDQFIDLHVGLDAVSRIPTSWNYSVEDPYAVIAEFHTGQSDRIQWRFARELLLDGLLGPVGEGDIRVRPHRGDGDLLQMDLRTPTGFATFDVDRASIRAFAEATTDLVPLGYEQYLVDLDELDALLIND